MIELLIRIRDKHEADGPTSPLASLDWTEINPALTAANIHDQAADKAKREKEREIDERKKYMPKVEQAARNARDILLGVYAANPKKLGDWSFKMTDAAASKDKKRSTGTASETSKRIRLDRFRRPPDTHTAIR